MDKTEQKKDQPAPVISPLASDKTYGERIYSRVFDWGLNYWTNLLASAGFSHWAANSTKKMDIPGIPKVVPRELQNNLGHKIASQWFMQGYKNNQMLEHGGTAAAEGIMNHTISELRASRLLKKASIIAERNLQKRGFAMAESLTLLVPGFAVMIPSVWLGAKIKPWLVEKLNEYHYGKEALDDPSLKARHQAIAAEVKPTLLGTIIARIGTVIAVQLSAKFIGSESNTFNWIGKRTNNTTLKDFKGINPVAESIGGNIGNSMPAELQQFVNRKAQGINFSWSDKQVKTWMKRNPGKLAEEMGSYSVATQDLSKYIAMDTIYTLVSAGTIHPLLRLLPHVPIIGHYMTYKPKVAENSPEFDGEKIKIKSHPLADTTPAPDSLNRAEGNGTPKVSNRPEARVNTVREQGTLTDRTLEVTA